MNAAHEHGGGRQGELLLELLSEEIPARMQVRAVEDLARLIRDKLATAEIPAARITGYTTPRRLTIIANGIPATQPERTEERRGPRIGAPAQAIDGFLRAAGLTRIEQCEMRDTGRGEFYFATTRRAGRAAGEVLPELLHAAIVDVPWGSPRTAPSRAGDSSHTRRSPRIRPEVSRLRPASAAPGCEPRTD